MKKNGFTLIELLITMAIIVMMALIAIPTFSKYEEAATFNAKVDEIVSAINQTAVSALNSEQNVNYYAVLVNTSAKTIGIYNDSSITKTIEMPSSVASINMETNGTSPVVTAGIVLKFNVGKNYVCNLGSISVSCLELNTFSGNYIKVTGTNGKQRIIEVKSNPVRAKIQ